MFRIAALCVLVAACGDGSNKRPLGAECAASDECSSGLCAAGQCLDPSSDNDLDGLANGVEAELGTDPLAADSDGDGVADPDELTAQLTSKDSDGDGVLDALESAAADADLDCVADQDDARNTTPDPDPKSVVDHCPPPRGVCAEGLVVMCRDGLGRPACEPIADYEATEASCDALDNDCDGETDEGLLNACGACGEVPVETCNGADDDCDGNTDEDLLNACGTCGEVPVETCNGADDDCDGATDEGCDPLLAGLIVHWPLDGDGADLSLHESDGTVTGATPTADRFGHASGALRFAGAGEVRVATTAHPGDARELTYALWVHPEGEMPGALVAFGGATQLALGAHRHCATAFGAAVATACAPDGYWSFLVVVKSGDTVTTWLDGVEQGTATAGGALAANDLVVGAGFTGAIADVRAWERALSVDEIERLFSDADGSPVGERPGRDCLHIRQAGRGEARAVPESGTYSIDLDGDGADAAFDAWCDMDLDGGGWTLAWVYNLTNSADFLNANNAVTPIPTWPKARGTSPTSTTPPASPTAPGAIEWGRWADIGREFAVISDLTDGIACTPVFGSLADGTDGRIQCRTVVDVTPTCQGTLPTRMGFDAAGPRLLAEGIYFDFEGDSATAFPAHDPCARDSAQHVAAPARFGGAIYLRATERAPRPPAQCNDVSRYQRGDGPHLIDPDDTGDGPAFEAECNFSVERGGWTRVSDEMLASMAERPDVARQFLYLGDDEFYVSPAVVAAWGDDYVAAPGRWIRSAAAGLESRVCQGDVAGTTGVGCGDEGFTITVDDALADGDATVCTADGCAPASIWVREAACVTDDGSLFGDGELDQVIAADRPFQSACFSAAATTGWKQGFTPDDDQVPPGGVAPSLRMTRPLEPTLNPAVQLVQPVTMVARRAYTLSFWAKAATRSRFNVAVGTDRGQGIYFERRTVTPEWRRYEIGFQAPFDAFRAFPTIATQEPGTTLWIDDLTLTEDGPTPCDGDGVNLVGNGDFRAGTTCWWPGNSDDTVQATFDLELDGGPDGAPAWRVDIDGAPSERWHEQTRNLELPIEAGFRYRLSYAAKASEPRSFAAYIADFDGESEDPPVWLNLGDAPLTTEWRTYTFDFVPGFATTDVLADLSFDFGWTAPSTLWIADVRLEKLEEDPCTVGPEGVPNASFDLGFACWEERHHWETIDLDVAVEDGVVVADILSNEDTFEYAAQIRTFGVPLVAGNVYEVRVKARSETPHTAYWNLQNYPSFYAGTQMFYDDVWRDYTWTVVPTETAPAADLEFGFAGQGFTGRTWFDDAAVIDHGPDGCKPADGELAPNVGFDLGRRCWNVDAQSFNRIWAALDDATFGAAAPSLRIDVASTSQMFDAWLQWQGLQVKAGVTYVVRYKAKASAPTTISVGTWEPPGTSIGYGEATLGDAWQEYSYEFTSPITSGPAGAFVSVNVGELGERTVWIDDLSIKTAPIPF